MERYLSALSILLSRPFPLLASLRVDPLSSLLFPHVIVSGFFKGNGTNLIKIAPESGIKFWAYESLKRVICRDNSAPTIQEKLIAGSTAGAISQTAIYPLEIVKTRLAVAEPGAAFFGTPLSSSYD